MESTEGWIASKFFYANDIEDSAIDVEDVREKLQEMQQEIDDLKFALEIIK